MRLQDTLNIEDLRRLARRRLPHFAFTFLDGGAEDEITLAGNRHAFARLRFRPRALAGVADRDLSTQLVGAPAALPVVVGPTGLNGMFRRNGDLELARASAAAGVPFVLSTVSTSRVEDVVRAAEGRLWMQAYVFAERHITDAILRRALAAGFETLVLTCDVPVAGRRERDFRTGLLPHARLRLAARLETLRHPYWLATVGLRPPRFVNVEQELPPGTPVNDYVARSTFDATLCWDHVRHFRDLWPGKLLLKGLLRADDAERALAAGADGIVLSNHGGRQLDGAVSAIDVLPEVARLVGGRLSILVDGGIRRGSDIAKAVALGAEGVLLGRAPLYGLAASGEAGVTRVLDILREEFDRTLALTGCRSVAALTPDLVVIPGA